MFNIYKNLLSSVKFQYEYFILNENKNICIFLCEKKSGLSCHCAYIRLGFFLGKEMIKITNFEFFTNNENQKYLNETIKCDYFTTDDYDSLQKFVNIFKKELYSFQE